MRIIGTLLAFSLAIVAATAAPSPSPTGPKKNAITGVDLQNLRLKVASKDGKEITYNVTVLTEIIVNGKPMKLEDVKSGMTAIVASSDGKNAERIEASGQMPPIAPKPKKKPKKKKK